MGNKLKGSFLIIALLALWMPFLATRIGISVILLVLALVEFLS